MSESYKDQQAAWKKRRERIRVMRSAGMKLQEIASVMGCTKARVHQLLANEVDQREAEKCA